MTHGRKALWWLIWPGFRQVWIHSSYPALALGVGAALLLNLLLATEFVWTEWLSSTARLVGWLGVLTIWSVAAAVTWLAITRERRQTAAKLAGGEAGEVEPLAAVIEEYLQGKWYEAERLLRQQMRREKKDAEAMLMLATLCRHTGRLDEAERRLDELAALEAAGKWEVEIATERRLIDRRRTDDQQTENNFQADQNDVPHGTPDMTRAA
ncbi:MAG: tetratricopeptide repeat protein [Planctomycetes bacterium]|nr:tetratricopeptide repeat protein [Planctomycetota bacterium]